MRILSFTNCPLDPKSGSGKTVLMYSQGLRELGHIVDVAEPKDYETWHGLSRAKKYRQAWGAWSFVKQKLRSHTYDSIEFYGDEFWLVIWQLSQWSERPLIVAHTNGLELLDWERSFAYKSRQNPLRNWIDKQTHVRLSSVAFARADSFVSLCELDRKYVLNLGFYKPDRAVVVEPGLDEEYLHLPFSQQQEERVAFMGNWTERKGVGKLSAVMSKILTENTRLYFDVYGTGGARETVLADFPTELHDRISIYPRLSNQEISTSLSKAKVFFFPSQYEGFGIALAEAMACSCAAVTTPTGFGAELQDGKEAILCDFDDVEGMEKAIKRLLQDDKLRLKIARSGWERVRSLNWEANIKKLAAIYSQWVTQHQSQ